MALLLPALLVGSGLKHATPARAVLDIASPGFIGREWIETLLQIVGIVTVVCSPGFIGREWIETWWLIVWLRWALVVLPALLVGSGLKHSLQN